MKMMKFFQFLSIINVQVIFSFAWHFCGPKLKICNEYKHFICDLTELTPLAGTAEFVGHVLETDMLKEELLEFHNVRRNSLAGGYAVGINETAFPTASRMREIHWDPELAYMARLYTSRVTMIRPKCFNTKRYKACGHIAGVLVVDDDMDLKIINENILQKFWSEHTTVLKPEALIDNFDTMLNEDVEHFALMANDRVSKVGCAISLGVNCVESKPDDGCYFLSCFYDESNKNNSFVYKKGKPGGECVDWGFEVNNRFDYLC